MIEKSLYAAKENNIKKLISQIYDFSDLLRLAQTHRLQSSDYIVTHVV